MSGVNRSVATSSETTAGAHFYRVRLRGYAPVHVLGHPMRVQRLQNYCPCSALQRWPHVPELPIHFAAGARHVGRQTIHDRRPRTLLS